MPVSARSASAVPMCTSSSRRPHCSTGPDPVRSAGLRLSARTAEALNDFRSALGAELARPEALDMSQTSPSPLVTAKENDQTGGVVHDQHDAATVLQASDSDNVFVGDTVADAASNTDRVVLLFPGQGAQHAEMARGLYESEPVFAENFDRCADGLFRRWGSTCARSSSTR